MSEVLESMSAGLRVVEQDRPVKCTKEEKDEGHQDSGKGIYASRHVLARSGGCVHVEHRDAGFTAVPQLEVVVAVVEHFLLLAEHVRLPLDPMGQSLSRLKDTQKDKKRDKVHKIK